MSKSWKLSIALCALALAGAVTAGSPPVQAGEVVLRVESKQQASRLKGSARELYKLYQAQSNYARKTSKTKSGNSAAVSQTGSRNGAALRQSGSGNTLLVGQKGRGNSATIEQSGKNNSLGVYQFGRNLNYDGKQSGNGRSRLIVQSGW
ncbi:MAG: hypothetical protein KJ587_06265 [Alphaproteobacteria bacterium]|nr:hypothetical protein [Alphaproteobacteria bacterium]